VTSFPEDDGDLRLAADIFEWTELRDEQLRAGEHLGQAADHHAQGAGRGVAAERLDDQAAVGLGRARNPSTPVSAMPATVKTSVVIGDPFLINGITRHQTFLLPRDTPGRSWTGRRRRIPSSSSSSAR
jgi:hypothetical protein